MSRRGWVLFLAVSTLWGLPYFMIRIAVRELDPVSVVMGRTLPAALVLLPIAWHSGALRTLRGQMKWLLLYTVVEFGIPWYLMASAEQHVTSSLASLIICATPLLSISVSKLLYPKRTIGRQRLIGLALGSFGVLTLVGLDITTDSAWWIGAMFLVAVGYAGGPQVISTKLTKTSGLAVVAVSVSLVAAIYTPLGLARWPAHVSGATWLSLGALALLCTIGAFLLFFALIKEVGPARSTVVTYLNTAIAVGLGVVFLHEPLTAGMLIGFPIIVAGSIFATSASKSVNEELRPTA
ncbi:unannotated protein [freshwater metagenome]|uniref:Unannotated protein n=1 Tax=freshwater metagenome TaxID=449393 RepID=A0A6J7E501_9ZZZZ|nr:DMT family transporter [Actinomycetota bacterium]MUH58550.1 EamA family transporter [Actinomycetota bacterium]